MTQPHHHGARDRGHDASAQATPALAPATAVDPLGAAARGQGEELVQMFGQARTDADSIRAAAGAGVAGAGQRMPHLDALQRAFGPAHDLSGVRAHVGDEASAACVEMGAAAYATGDAVAFRAAPSLHLAAHEAAHVVQQRQGVSLPGGVGQKGDPLEQHADAVADRVAAGRSAADLLGTGSGTAGHAGGDSVQRYIEGDTEALGTARFSDDWSMVVLQESAIGSQTFYALPEQITASDSALQAAGSVIELKEGSEKIEVPKGLFQGMQTLHQVVPSHKAGGGEGEDMELWADCGRSAMAVSGIGGANGEADREVRSTDAKGGELDITAERPERAKYKLVLEHFGDEIDKAMLGKVESQWQRHTSKLRRAESKKDTNAIEVEKKILSRIAVLWHNVMMAPYHRLPPEERDAVDKKLGINEHAAPEIGEAFTISSGGQAHEGYEENTWNWHFAGVVMRSGADTVTLENYAVGDYKAQNKDWAFQMYGPASKPGQTFHEQHHDTKLHGKDPMTFRIVRK